MRETISIIFAAASIFGVVAVIILRFMPQPIEDSDYMVAGSVATETSDSGRMLPTRSASA